MSGGQFSNPPWERIKLQEEEFFATRHPDIAAAQHKAERSRRIELLKEGRLFRTLHQEADAPAVNATLETRLHEEFQSVRRQAEGLSQFAHLPGSMGGRYPLTGVGDVNTYALFAESISQLRQNHGRAGFIVPSGIATDDSTKGFFSAMADSGHLASLYDLENREGIFEGVHRSFKFCLLTLGKVSAGSFSFYLTDPDQLRDTRRVFALTAEDFKLINPNTRTCPIFRSERDASLTQKIYRRVPVLIREETEKEPEINPWGIRFNAMFHMSNDSDIFRNYPATEGKKTLPLYEAKMIHQFDHRWATYVTSGDSSDTVDVTLTQKQDPNFQVAPRYWVEEKEVLARIARVPRTLAKAYAAGDARKALHALAIWVEETVGEALLKDPRQAVVEAGGKLFERLPTAVTEWRDAKIKAEVKEVDKLTDAELSCIREAKEVEVVLNELMDTRSPKWLMGFRDICRATDERTVIASVIPRVGVGNSLPLMIFNEVHNPRVQLLLLGNLCSLVLDFVARHKVGGTHLNFFIIKQLPVLPPEAYSEKDVDYLVPRILELTYTENGMQSLAELLGFSGKPFLFNPERRAVLRAELDAYYARLMGLGRDELEYILDPASTMGEDYPSETFRGLKNNDLKECGEYRTQRLVLEAWDALP